MLARLLALATLYRENDENVNALWLGSNPSARIARMGMKRSAGSTWSADFSLYRVWGPRDHQVASRAIL